MIYKILTICALRQIEHCLSMRLSGEEGSNARYIRTLFPPTKGEAASNPTGCKYSLLSILECAGWLTK